jgi:hypothetical protein
MMRNSLLLAASLLVIGLATHPQVQAATPELASANSFASIQDPRTRSLAIFGEMSKVITGPRCMNCHPRSDSPTLGEAMTQHNPPVVRGTTGFGAPGMECGTCHGATNVTFSNGKSSIPGNPKWALAPRSMAWQGQSLHQICEQIKDPARNGGKSLDELTDHNGKDPLVGWAWSPGLGRPPALGTQAEFGALTAAWVASGASCPD